MSVRIAEEVDPQASEFVTAKLVAFNDAGHPFIASRREAANDPYDVSMFARNEQGGLVGGVLAQDSLRGIFRRQSFTNVAGTLSLGGSTISLRA